LESEPISIRAAERPDAPRFLSNVPSITSGYQVGLAWEEGVYDGGSPVIDYRIQYRDEFTAEYTVLQEEILAREFTATGLTPGMFYYFVAEARNLIGFSVYSDSLYVLAA
jgi:hypothetical protein